MFNFVKTSLVLSTLLLISCGVGESRIDADAQGFAEAGAQGFAENGIFTGSLPEGGMLLILERGSYFLVAGDIASQGSYQIDSFQLSGSGPAYSLSANGELTGALQLRGEYRTDRNLELIWTESSTRSERSLNVEATLLYYEEASLDNVLGTWINQDEANLVIFGISENKNKDPIGGDDFDAERALEFRTAEIDGIIVSSLTQISGSITENPFGANVYSIELDFGGSLGGGSGATDSFNGYVITSEENVETQSDVEGEPPTLQLRPTILILAASPSAVYLNKLFGVSEDELSES